MVTIVSNFTSQVKRQWIGIPGVLMRLIGNIGDDFRPSEHRYPFYGSARKIKLFQIDLAEILVVIGFEVDYPVREVPKSDPLGRFL